MSFNDKIELDQHHHQHQNNTTQSIELYKIQSTNQYISVKMDIKTSHINVFNYCLNVLRDNEGLTGEKALRNLSYLLILKLIEPHFSGEINIDTYNYDFSHIEDDLVEHHRKKLLEIVRFSNLAVEDESNLTNVLKYLWEDILASHPTTKNIFLKGKYFDIQYKSSFKRIIDKLHSLDLSQSNYDAMGNAYEDVIQGSMTGKVLGQFFTQPLLKNMMVKLIDPQMHPDGKIETCGDPTMGTGGFLITYLQHVLKQAKTQNITPDWNFIKTEGLYGKEKEPDTFQLAALNMLISTGHMFENIELGDSIRVPITKKFDNILANPPFGIKGLNYSDFYSPLKFQYTPIKTNNAVSLFIQSIVYMLKIDGKCAVVIPYGQDLFSKTNTVLIAIREYLMKTCDLKEIIILPSHIFTYTSINTCVFYFVKKREGGDVLETNVKFSRTQKETGRDYKFSQIHSTKTVKFYDYDLYKDVKTLLVEVPIEQIAENSYSLNYNDYIKNETDSQEYEEGIVVKTLGEVCKFLPKSKKQASYGNKEGAYPFYTSSQKCVKYCNVYDYEDECLIIGSGGTANIKYSSKFSCSTDNFVIKINNGNLIKYVYYYLLNNIEILQKGFKGVGLEHISKDYIIKLKIPFPSLERQQEIVDYCEHNDELIKQHEKEIENNKKQTKQYMKCIVKSKKIKKKLVIVKDFPENKL
jgi:type I restriction-modification system DNA methylase subunit